ncbi:MAG: ROK family transcriptional regulator [Bacillota bacterium]|nr:ROK family transcriptional regulator [Bacillota bacterium]
MEALDQSNIKINNRKRIIRLLSKERELTKLDIARNLDISVPTVTTIVGELIEEGLVEEAGMAGSTGGRKPVIIRFLPDSRYSIGVDLGTDSVRAILTNLDSRIIVDKRKALKSREEANVLASIEVLVKEILKEQGINKEILLGVGFSLPGTVDEENLKLEMAANLKLKNLSFSSFKDLFEVPIYLENEANAGALAEWQLGIARDKRNVIYISITEGVGGGIIIDGKMYKGTAMRAGEIGHMTINKNGRQCNCGKKGCWETYASKKALINDYIENGGEATDNIKTIMDMLSKGDEKAAKVIEKYINDLAEGIQNLLFIFNPDNIVIGGDISSYPDIILGSLTDRIFEQNQFYSTGDVNIMFSALGEDANILGASLIPIFEAFAF